ncbi:oligopeptide/dipeptide ABC transporter ATP-binding protein [Butyrivibrio sp. AE3004]|uniref:oligopeptide/dipeptide ABC transporter ATP-binding protein n=1 Tax=Butyrivibrio sp. AE3004 TaxID=1506994 RepID=UPI0004949E29|nr:oligopeptide/dipeptide ABC transporter ATP-binding protein [Butyrivibrio sp. AE3004]
MKNIVELKGVNKIYTDKSLFGKTKKAHILKDITLSIKEGQTLGLVGESGSGKTTLTRMILRQEAVSSGEIYYKGKNTADFTSEDEKEYRRAVQVVFQDPVSSLDPKMKIKDIIAEPLEISSELTKEEKSDRVRKMMSYVGLAEDYLDRYPGQFSGGQQQRITIARALVQSPRLLILDEPVSALDVSVRGQIMNLLKSFQSNHKVSYLFISHDIITVGFLSDMIAVMYFGHIVEYASTDTILNRHLHPYTAMLLESNGAKNLDEVESDTSEAPSHLNPPKGCPFAERCRFATASCRERIPYFEEVEKNHFVACHNLESIQKYDFKKHIVRTEKPEYII